MRPPTDLLLALAFLVVTVHVSAAEEPLAPLRKVLAGQGFALPSLEAPPPAPFHILSATQDWARPTPDLCCHTLTPLRIGQATFRKGIGAHANGRIVVALAAPFRRFSASVGVDNNSDTGGTRGSVLFIVKVDGQERARTPVCRGGEEARKLEVDLTGARQLELLVSDAGDGYSYDQADWAEAVLQTETGERLPVGDALVAGGENPLLAGLPTSFAYGGQPCWKLFSGWRREALPVEAVRGGSRHAVRWSDPKSGFEATLAVTLFENPPAAELGWRLANRGTGPSEPVTDLHSIELRAPSTEGRSTLLSSSGGLTGGLDGRGERTGFALSTTPLGEKTLTVSDGRSSNGDLPFFLLREGTSGWGIAAGLGWSGQWRAQARFDKETREVSLRAGMEPVHFRLAPGQAVSLPTAVLVPFRGPDSEGSNRLRRVLREGYQARLGGQPVPPPVSFNSWFVFGNNVNEKLLGELADAAAPLGIEYFCLDAGWFEGGFPGGVGNWSIDRAKFPNGLKPVAERVHRLGMKFGLWFEPERVAAGTRWAKEHPDWVTGDLLDLGRPEARACVLQMLDSLITEIGVDWIRYDFNTGPLGAWQRLEDKEHQGLRQIQHVNGLYEVLDELMRRHPSLLIEQCASGGRRIDLETIRRGHTVWKSDDTHSQPLMRFHETGGNLFLPGGLLNTNLCRIGAPGEVAALFAGPLGFGADLRRLTPEERAALARAIAAYKRVRPLINEDYFPLFAQSADAQGWNGWEFLASGAREGAALLYRQPGSPYPQAEVRLSGLDPEASYALEELLSGRKETLSGRQLAEGWCVSLERDAAQVWRFVSEAARPPR